jgi:SAM-dependent methyltransferase
MGCHPEPVRKRRTMSVSPNSGIGRYQASILRQIEAGVIVCPETKRKLRVSDGASLTTDDGSRSYRLAGGAVPILITDNRLVEEYARSSEQMNKEYTIEHLRREQRWITRIRRHDYRTQASERAANSVLEGLDGHAVCVSIGGGPTRANEMFVNLNIGPFPNVDIVGDAHKLPYADGSVDAIRCEAVFEHLHSPVLAASEIFRVLKRGGKAYVCTPFLQAYHGYPHHYQNFTLTGHVNLFERSGLRVLVSGTAVGPIYVLRNMVAVFIANYTPRPIRRGLQAIWAGISMLIAPLDMLVRDRPDSHVMASTTFLVAERP